MKLGSVYRGVARGTVAACVIVALAAAAEALPRRSSAPTYPDQPKQGQEAPKAEQYEAPFPTKMNWTLSDINGKGTAAEATLMIDDNYRGTGTSGCNTWSAALYPIKGHKLAMGPVAQTKRSCAADVMQFEHLYLGILHSGPTWDQTGYTLTVKSQAGTLTFKRGL